MPTRSRLMNGTTLRLVFPQWQGGNNPPYHLGSKLLDWLAPEHVGPSEEVPVSLPTDEPLPVEGGIVARRALLQQLRKARQLIDKHRPDRLVVLGGDCLVDLAPFAYLNERYAGDLAVLWVDTHPDIMTPAQFRALLFAQPTAAAGAFDGIAQGRLSMEQVVRLLGDVAGVADVVGLGIAEHLPWDALALKNMLARLPLIGAAHRA